MIIEPRLNPTEHHLVWVKNFFKKTIATIEVSHFFSRRSSFWELKISLTN